MCRIRKLGYPLRKDFVDFVKRYTTIVRSAKNIDDLIKGLEAKGILKEGQWAKGTTKVFLKAPQSVELEIAREDSLLETAVVLQKYGRRYIMKVKMVVWRRELELLKGAITGRTEDALQKALDNTSELPGAGKHLPLVAEASALLIRLQEEARCVAFLEQAISKHDKALLTTAIESAKGMDFAPPVLADAEKVLARIQEEEALLDGLKAAVAARDRSELDASLHECEAFGIKEDNEIMVQASALSHRLAEEDEITHALEDAVSARSLQQLSAFVNKCSEMGFEPPLLKEATALKGQLQKEAAAKEALGAAIAARDEDALKAAIAGAGEYDGPEVADARSLLTVVEKERGLVQAVKAAAASNDLDALKAALSAAAAIQGAAISDAKAVLDGLEKVEACKANLKDAAASSDTSKLSDALGEAASLSMAGPEVDAAKAAMKKLGAKGEAAGNLRAACEADTVADVEAAIEAAVSAGISAESSEVNAAKDAIARINNEVVFVKELDKAQDSAAIQKLLAEGETKGYRTSTYKAAVTAAKSRDAVGAAVASVKAERSPANALALEKAVREASERGADVTSGQAMLDQLKREKELEEAMRSGLAAKDAGAVKAAFEEATSLGMMGETYDEAKIAVEREALVEKTNKILEMSDAEFEEQAKGDPVGLEKALNDALENAITLGLSQDAISKATERRETMSDKVASAKALLATIEALAVKEASPSGIVDADYGPVESACSASDAIGLTKPVEDGRLRVEKAKKQIAAQANLKEVLDSKDRVALKKALDAAEDLDLNLTTMATVKKKLRALDKAFRDEQQKKVAAGGDDGPVTDKSADELATLREARQARAANAKYFRPSGHLDARLCVVLQEGGTSGPTKITSDGARTAEIAGTTSRSSRAYERRTTLRRAFCFRNEK